MIHELIDPKKKTNKASASRNTKTLQNAKNIFEDCNFEASDNENKEAEFSSTTFIPPWLRNSLGLNQRNNLSHATAGSDLKSAKIIHRGKEPSQNELDSLKTNNEQDCCKKLTDHFEILPQDCPQEVDLTKGADNVGVFDGRSERTIPVYWNVKRKESETESSCTNAETKSLKKEDSKMINTDVLTSPELGKFKEEDKKRLKLIKQKYKLKKRIMGDQKQSDLDKNDVDFLLEMKAREVLDNYMKKDVHSVSSEMKNLEAKLVLLSSKSQNMNHFKLNQQDLLLLQEIKNQVGSPEEFGRIFEHLKEINIREIIKNADFLAKNMARRKIEEKEENSAREIVDKTNDNGKSNADKDSLLSTDDENDIKRFSEFLSKNKNLDEKRKCLEEVRNYFERKRKSRLTKRRFLEEGKAKANPEGKEELVKDKAKLKEVYRGKKSKFALCDEEVVEKAVDETLQKFVELYRLHVSPTVMGNMKKNILQAMTTEPSAGSSSKLTESAPAAKKINLELLNAAGKEAAKPEARSLPDAEVIEISNKDSGLYREVKKKNFKSVIENGSDQVAKPPKETDVVENENLKRLKKEFDNFLHSVQAHIDVTNLKLQSIILEKEEQTKNVQFVYNFTKKSLESDKTGFRDVLEFKNRKDCEAQTNSEIESIKRNVKVQAFEHKNFREQSLQTEEKIFATQTTQTKDEGVMVRELKELKSYDVNPGLYRMVKSKEAGKFYLYPEQLEDSNKQEACENSNSSVVKDKKFTKKRDLLNILSKERTKERRSFFREKSKLKKTKKGLHGFTHLKATSAKKGKINGVTSGNSISCLYFKNFDQKNSESFPSKKGVDLPDEPAAGELDIGKGLRIGDSKEIPKENHGCYWFWNGVKIAPGCDLKTHVEDLLKEKLKEMANAEDHPSEVIVNSLRLSAKDNEQQSKASEKNLDVRNTANTVFCFSDVQNTAKENSLVFTENESLEEKNKAEEKKAENEDMGTALMAVSEEKLVRNVAIQNSQQTVLSLNLSKLKVQPKMSTAIKKNINKRHIVIKPNQGKTVNFKKAEDIIRAVEELKKIKLELENSKKEYSVDSESLLDSSTSTSGSKNGTNDTFPVVLGLKDNSEAEEMYNLDLRNRLKKLISLVDREIQTPDSCDLENTNSAENQAVDSHKHLELIENVLSRVNQKEREGLWNDVRDFIKTKIGRDINDEGVREVCIEIEQNMPKNEQGGYCLKDTPVQLTDSFCRWSKLKYGNRSLGKLKHAVLARGHYTRNEGDVEVEIDLTLNDLEKILRQREKKMRRRTLYRNSKSKKFLSNSSIQSDFTRDDLRRYHKYLHRFAALGGGVAQDKDMKAFLEK